MVHGAQLVTQWVRRKLSLTLQSGSPHTPFPLHPLGGDCPHLLVSSWRCGEQCGSDAGVVAGNLKWVRHMTWVNLSAANVITNVLRFVDGLAFYVRIGYFVWMQW